MLSRPFAMKVSLACTEVGGIKLKIHDAVREAPIETLNVALIITANLFTNVFSIVFKSTVM